MNRTFYSLYQDRTGTYCVKGSCTTVILKDLKLYTRYLPVFYTIAALGVLAAAGSAREKPTRT